MIALYQWDPSESSLRNSPLGNKTKFFMLRRGVKIFQNNKIKEREHSNKWDPSERFFKEPLLWGIKVTVRRVVKIKNQ